MEREKVVLASGRNFKDFSAAKKFLTALGLLCNATRMMLYVQEGNKFVRRDEMNVNLASDYPSEFNPSYNFTIDPNTGFEDVNGICNFGELADKASAFQVRFEGDKGAGLYIPIRLKNPITGDYERALIVAEREFWNRDGTLRWRESYLPKHMLRTPVVATDDKFADESINILTLLIGHFGSVLLPDRDDGRQEGIEMLRARARDIANDDHESLEILRRVDEEMIGYFPEELKDHVKSVGKYIRALTFNILRYGSPETKALLPRSLRTEDPFELAIEMERLELEGTAHDISKMFTPKSWFCVEDDKRTDGQKRRSHRHPIASYMIMDGIPYLFRHGSDMSRHHWDRIFAVPQTFLSSIALMADLSSALMDGRVGTLRPQTLLETYAVIGSVMHKFVKEYNEALTLGDAPKAKPKQIALMLTGYIEFLRYGTMEPFIKANQPLFPQTFVPDPQGGVKHHHANTNSMQLDLSHTLEHVHEKVSGRQNDVKNLIADAGINLTDKHDVVRQKLMGYFSDILLREDFRECLKHERFKMSSSLTDMAKFRQREDGFLFTDALMSGMVGHKAI